MAAKTFPDVGKALGTCSEARSTRLESLTTPHRHLPSAFPRPLTAPYRKPAICQVPPETRQRLFQGAMVKPYLRADISKPEAAMQFVCGGFKALFMQCCLPGQIKSERSHAHHTGNPARVSWNKSKHDRCWGAAHLLASFPLWIVLTQTDEAEISSHNGTKLHYKLLTQIT